MVTRLATVFLLLGVSSPSSVVAQNAPVGTGNPLATGPGEDFKGEWPTTNVTTQGGGIVLPNSAGDVTRPSDIRQNALAEVRAVSEARKIEARKLAERVLAGATVPEALVPKLRDALARDVELWRAEYGVGDKEYGAAQARWLKDIAALTPPEWVLWRAAWFDERDKWVAARAVARR